MLNLLELKERLQPGYVVTIDGSGFVCLRYGRATIAVFTILAATPDRIGRAVEMHKETYKEARSSNLSELQKCLQPGYTTVEDGDLLYLCYRGRCIAAFSALGATLEAIKEAVAEHMRTPGIQGGER